MARIQAFEAYTKDYEAWFERHPLVYQSELQAVRARLPSQGDGIEIGVGSGRFAVPLKIGYGVDPSPKMCACAAEHPIQITLGTAESLPIATAQFDFVLMVTTLCFVEDGIQSFHEIHRILRPEGVLILGFVDKTSPLGQQYYQNRAKSRFYKEARFYTVKEVLTFLENTGFHSVEIYQTLFQKLDQIEKVEPVRAGYGQGSFVVIKANKK
ncbi:class I SAM-dependent methyltransferase [candidate division KSB1 bacterium]|nr:class I SAM-dependent methyltransferase [candidate division KSB1 bacterium]